MPQTRIAFADTNWLFSLYYQTRDRTAIAAWAEKGAATIVVSAAVLAECRCNFWRAGDRLMALESDLKARLLGGGAGPMGGYRATGDQTNCGMTQENIEKACGLAGGCRMSRWGRGGRI